MPRNVIYTDGDGDEFFVTPDSSHVFIGAHRPDPDLAVSVRLPVAPEAIDALLTDLAAALGREPCEGGFRELRRSPLEVWVRESLVPYVETHRNYAKMSTADAVVEAFLVAVTDPAVWADFQEAIHDALLALLAETGPTVYSETVQREVDALLAAGQSLEPTARHKLDAEGPRTMTAEEYTRTLAACRMASNDDDGDTALPCVD